MITHIIYGATVFRQRQTSTGLYLEFYNVSEQTGRENLKLITVIPTAFFNKKSPFFMTMQIPIEELTYVDDGIPIKGFHPAMTL